ncbi:MAG: FAD-dependent monooxygenase [Hyphomonas sp.]|uniref:FAD-dependent monooxygenase n=1 Tax=Hyphomonas sp. TaxID=87 RepID=UPI003528D34F
MDVLIIGGGIGGLTAALALEKRGHTVTVAEQSGVISEVGAGLQLSPNAMKVLNALGVGARVMRDAFRPQALEMRWGKRGGLIFDVPLRKAAVNRWGAEYIHIHRADLIEALREELLARAPDALRLGHKLDRNEQKGDRIIAHFAGGQTIDADLIVGADGIHSAVRAQMLGPDKAQFTGNVAWRATVPVSALGDNAPPPTACVWAGPRRHAVTYLLRRGSVANFVGVVEHKTPGEESWTATGAKEQALKDFKRWHPKVRAIIEAADTLNRWPLYGRPMLPKWHEGRAVLLGDACHPMLPFLAQGAAMAIEDAWALAACLEAEPDVDTALKAYETRRKPRATRVQEGARANAKLFHRGDPLTRFGTYVPMWMAAQAAPGFIHSRNDWLYGHDETAA